MGPEPWQQIKKLYEAALDHPEEDRAGFLRNACADDKEVREEIESLVNARREIGAFLEVAPAATRSPDDLATQGGPALPDSLLGRQIGIYTLQRVLGHGGMGTVYEAEQTSPRRRVALKIIRGGGHVDEQVVKLFHREVQALALLNHPHIAALYEAGRTEDGRHYFAMELVPGIPLTDFARKSDLPIDRRLELFIKVCEAIAYAHQRGVIHRDIKPSNILVVEEGAETQEHEGTNGQPSFNASRSAAGQSCLRASPKVLDFGLAKITNSDVAVTTMISDAGKIQGTLAYMSPEQARGRSNEIDLRSDIYSLGVIFYELLTGQLPYDVRSAPLPHAIRLICEEPPCRPSSIHRALKGDLETILLKALEKEPSRRYQSASEFSSDVRRFLASEPVLARPPSALYQMKKLVARNKIPATLVGLIAVIVLGFGIGMSVLFAQSQDHLVRAVDAEGQAASRADRAEQLSRFFLDVMSSMGPSTANEFGYLVQNRIWRLTDTVPESLRELIAFRRLVVLENRRRLGDSPPIANELLSLGVLAIARSDFAEAEELMSESVRIMRAYPEHFRGQMGFALYSLGDAIFSEGNGRPAEAASVLNEALQFQCTAFGDNDPHALAFKVRLAGVLIRTGRLAEAKVLLTDSIHRLEDVFGLESAGTRELAYRSKGELHLIEGDLDSAVASFQEAIRVSEQWEDKPQPLFVTRGYLATCLMLQNRPAEARAVIEAALYPVKVLILAAQLLHSKGARDSALSLAEEAQRRATQPRDEVAAGLWVTRLQCDLYGPCPDHEQICRDLFARSQAACGDRDRLTADAALTLARSLLANDRKDEALGLMEERLRICTRWLGTESNITVSNLACLGTILRRMGRLAEAEPVLAKALASRERNLPDDNSDVGWSRWEYGLCLRGLGRMDEAETPLLEGARIVEKAYGQSSHQMRGLFDNLASFYQLRGDAGRAAAWRARMVKSCQAAIEHYEQLLAFGAQPHPNLQRDLSNARDKLIDGLLGMGRAIEARSYIRQVEKPAPFLVRLGTLHFEAARFQEAELLFQEAIEKATNVPDRVGGLLGVADILLHFRRDFEKSEACAREALKLSQGDFGERDLRTQSARRILAHACLRQERLDEAAKLFNDGLRICNDASGPDPVQSSWNLVGMGVIELRRNHPDNAETYIRKALAIYEARHPPEENAIAGTRARLGECLVAQGRYDEGEKLLLESFPIIEDRWGPDSLMAQDFVNVLAILYASRGDEVRAAKWRAKLPPNRDSNSTLPVRKKE